MEIRVTNRTKHYRRRPNAKRSGGPRQGRIDRAQKYLRFPGLMNTKEAGKDGEQWRLWVSWRIGPLKACNLITTITTTN